MVLDSETDASGLGGVYVFLFAFVSRACFDSSNREMRHELISFNRLHCSYFTIIDAPEFIIQASLYIDVLGVKSKRVANCI